MLVTKPVTPPPDRHEQETAWLMPWWGWVMLGGLWAYIGWATIVLVIDPRLGDPP